MSFGAPPCSSPAEPGWRRTLTTSEREARKLALELAAHPGSTEWAENVVKRAEAYRAFLMGETK